MKNFKLLKGYDDITTLQVSWEPEHANDLISFHNVNYEEELTRHLSQEISNQIDSEIIIELTRRINGGGMRA